MHQYKLFQDQINVNNNNREDHVKTDDGENRREDVSGKSNINKKFDVILKEITNNGRATKSINVKSRAGNINSHLLIRKLLNSAEK